MNKTIIIIGITVLLILLGVQQYIIWKNTSVSTDDLIIEKINKLESKIDSLSTKRDSIKTIIIKVDKEIEDNQKHYEKVANIILNNNDSANRIFIDNYIKQYIDRIAAK